MSVAECIEVAVFQTALQRHLIAIYLACLSMFIFIYHGYQYGYWEQVFYIPIIKHLIDPSFLANDWFTTLAPYHTNVLSLLIVLSKILSLPGAFLFLQLICLTTYVTCTFLIAKELFKDERIAMLSAFVLAVIVPHGIGGYRILQVAFTPIMLGNALLLVSLLYFLRKNFFVSFLFAFLCAKAHLLIGMNWLLILVPYYMWTMRKKTDIREIVYISIAGLLLIGPDIFFQTKLLLQQPHDPFLADIFMRVNVSLRYPHHYLVFFSGMGSLAYLILMFWFILLSAAGSSQYKLTPSSPPLLKERGKGGELLLNTTSNQVFYIVMMIASFIMINLFCVDLFKISFIAKLQLLRLTYLIEYIFLLMISALFYRTYITTHHKLIKFVLTVTTLALPIIVWIFPENYKAITIIWALFTMYLIVARTSSLKKLAVPIHRMASSRSTPPLLKERGPGGELLILLITSAMIWGMIALPTLSNHINPSLPQHSPDPWLELCQWVKMNTPKDAVFITPPDQAGFRLFAERAIVVDFEACPYLKKDIASWKERMNDLAQIDAYDRTVRSWAALPHIKAHYAKLSRADIAHIIRKYQASYLVSTSSTLPWQKVYQNRAYSLYKP